jgi:four helix bundle protein
MEIGYMNTTITTFQDLRVYQSAYKLMKIVLTEIIPKLPQAEKYDLADQMRRACKAPPALIAEGFAKRYQNRNWKNYLTNAMGECYEMINHLSVCRDVYSVGVDSELYTNLIDEYTIVCKQLTNLSKAWTNYHEN